MNRNYQPQRLYELNYRFEKKKTQKRLTTTYFQFEEQNIFPIFQFEKRRNHRDYLLPEEPYDLKNKNDYRDYLPEIFYNLNDRIN
jgi:hypothetical protein